MHKLILLDKLKLLFLALICLVTSTVSRAQENGDTYKGLNEYVKFANESIHGMLIAHRLFENYNQDLNKYVDLPGHQLNFYNNNDLPQDIFEDPDQWFYEISPLLLFEMTSLNQYDIDDSDHQKLQAIANEIRNTTLRANTLRLSVADSINLLDMNDTDALYSVYDQLESASDAFDLLQAQITILENEARSITDDYKQHVTYNQYRRITKILQDMHLLSKELLLALKKEQNSVVRARLSELIDVTDRFSGYDIREEGGSASAAYVLTRKSILNNLEELISSAGLYLGSDPIPEEYALYGRSYYFFNTRIVNKVNRYGNGITPAINNLIDLLELPMIHKLEIPHYLNIIYPQKAEKKVPVIRATVAEVKEAPVSLENRTVVMSDKKHQILVDDINPELEIFDHLKQDGDIISLNFNGDWIFENLSLERKPRNFILELNDKGKNFLILHAVNEGSVPPNTIGINYIHKGRKKRYIMQSNLRTSQMVEIKLDK